MAQRHFITGEFETKAAAPPANDGLERKFIPLADFKGLEGAGPGNLEGYVSIFGNLDDGGDIILEGAYPQEVIDDFLKSGFTAHSHIWDVDTGQIGYPMSARADSTGLWVDHKFHSTDDAQRIRTKARERLADGKEVGLSIGYKAGPPTYVAAKDYATELPKYVKAEHLTEAMEKAKRFPRVRVLTKIVGLAESSIVTRAMNMLAMAANVKGDAPGAGGEETASTAPANENPNPEAAAAGAEGEAGGDKGQGELFGDEKIGARNSAADVKRVQAIHDAAAELHGECCPGTASSEKEKGTTAVKVSDRIKGFFKGAYANLEIMFPSLKGMFSTALAESTAATPWQVFYALMDVISQISDLQQSAEGTDIVVDVNQLVDEALAEMAGEMRVAIMRRLDQIADQPQYIYYAMPPAELKSKVLFKDLESEPLKDHSLAVVSAVEDLDQHSGTLQEAVNAFLERVRNKQQFRLDDGKTLSANAREIKTNLDTGLRAAADKIVAAADASEALVLLEPADLTAQFRKLQFETERLRTNALASSDSN